MADKNFLVIDIVPPFLNAVSLAKRKADKNAFLCVFIGS
jgi:hypothetical protein